MGWILVIVTLTGVEVIDVADHAECVKLERWVYQVSVRDNVSTVRSCIQRPNSEKIYETNP